MAILGVIADDFTGATDIAGMLVKGGMRTIQTIGVPPQGAIPDDVDAVVVALKSRSIAARDAIGQSLDALKALQAAGCKRFFFKYCSTFDSTDQGNIGPVGDALMDALGAKQAGTLEYAHGVLKKITGTAPVGWRAPFGLLTRVTFDYLAELGYLYDSSFQDDDYPYVVQCETGKRIVELFKQIQYNPMAVEIQASVLWTIQNGFFDTVPVDKLKAFQFGLQEFLVSRKDSLLAKLREKGAIDDAIAAELKDAVTEYKQGFKA